MRQANRQHGWIRRRVLGAAIALASAATLAQPSAGPTRGALLYETHCVACHSSQVHWRDKKLATDWKSLELQVRHWQAAARLDWSEADIVEVTRHLNDAIYRFPQTSQRLTLQLGPAPR